MIKQTEYKDWEIEAEEEETNAYGCFPFSCRSKKPKKWRLV